MPVFATGPKGVPPVGGSNIPFGDLKPGAAISVTPPLIVPGKGLSGLREEVIALRRDINQLMDMVKSLTEILRTL